VVIPKWVRSYYEEVILVDERRFLVSEAMKHVRIVEEGNVRGSRKEILRDGKNVEGVVVAERVMEVWREYERRGKEERE
jgi:hypothetical protein